METQLHISTYNARNTPQWLKVVVRMRSLEAEIMSELRATSSGKQSPRYDLISEHRTLL